MDKLLTEIETLIVEEKTATKDEKNLIKIRLARYILDLKPLIKSDCLSGEFCTIYKKWDSDNDEDFRLILRRKNA